MPRVGESVTWCEDLENRDVLHHSAEEECAYKYLVNGIQYWAHYASVAFVAELNPDCEGDIQRFCLPWALGENCLEFCPVKIGRIKTTLFGNPDQIETLATFGFEVWESNGQSVNAHLLDGNYPASRWTIAPGANLIFAHRACYARRYVGYDGLFLVTGVYPVEGDIVFDVDDASTTLTYLASKLRSLELELDEAEDYARRCSTNYPSEDFHNTADDGQSGFEEVLDPPTKLSDL